MAQSVTDLLQSNLNCEQIDDALGFLVFKIEKELLDSHGHFKNLNKKSPYKSETWVGLEPKMLQTPYPEIQEFTRRLIEYGCKDFVDFGAAYSRLGVVLNALLSDFSYSGYELVPERVQDSLRVFRENNFKNYKIYQENILHKTKIPQADAYFIYDFSTLNEQRIVLDLFSKKMYTDRFFLVARGHGVRSLIQNKYREFYACHGAIHRDNYSIYSSFKDL